MVTKLVSDVHLINQINQTNQIKTIQMKWYKGGGGVISFTRLIHL